MLSHIYDVKTNYLYNLILNVTLRLHCRVFLISLFSKKWKALWDISHVEIDVWLFSEIAFSKSRFETIIPKTVFSGFDLPKRKVTEVTVVVAAAAAETAALVVIVVVVVKVVIIIVLSQYDTLFLSAATYRRKIYYRHVFMNLIRNYIKQSHPQLQENNIHIFTLFLHWHKH